MDKERIKGSYEQAKGSVKEAVGKATGDEKLETEGKAGQGNRQDPECGRQRKGRSSREVTASIQSPA